MISPPIPQSYHSLLQKCQRLVNIHGFHLRFSNRQRFSEPLGSSEVHQVEFGGDVFRVGLHTRVRLNVDGEDTVRTRRTLVESMLSDDSICLTLENSFKDLLLSMN